MRRAFWDFTGILTSGAANPAMWVCLALALSYWRSTFALTLTTAWIIALASFSIRKAIFYRSYGRSASQAETALDICRRAYNLQVCQPIDILKDGDVSKTSLPLTSGKVFRLTPKAGNEPLTTFKSFLQPETKWSESVFLLPGSRRVGTAEKFFVLHEIGHSSEAGHIAQLNAQWAWLRLSIAYGPLLVVSASWSCIALVAVLFGLHVLHEAKNEILIEADADWNAWTAYYALFGAEETARATLSIARLFDLKAKLADDRRHFEMRAQLARAFSLVTGQTDQIRTRRILKIKTLHMVLKSAVSFGIQIAAGLLVYFTASKSQPLVLMVGVLLTMWVGLIMAMKIFKNATHEMWKLANLIDGLDVLSQLDARRLEDLQLQQQ